MLSRVIRSGIQAGERDEGICALQGHTFEGVNQCSADDRADAVDRAQVRDMLFASRTASVARGLWDSSFSKYPAQ